LMNVRAVVARFRCGRRAAIMPASREGERLPPPYQPRIPSSGAAQPKDDETLS